MQQPVTRSIGGTVLAASAVVLAASVLLHPPTGDSLAAYAEASGGFTLAAWLMALAGLLWVAGTIVLARQFNGTRSEAWATLGYTGALFGGIGLFLVGAIESFGFEGLATGAIFSHTEEAYTALAYTSFGLGMIGIAAYYAGVAFFGVAMIRSDDWPGWLGWSGAAVGTAIVALQALADGQPETLLMAASMIGLVWVAVAGWTLRGMGTETAAAETAQPPRMTESV